MKKFRTILIPVFSLLLLGALKGEQKAELKTAPMTSHRGDAENAVLFLEKNASEILSELKKLKITDKESYKGALSDAIVAQKEFTKVMGYDPVAAKSYLQMYRNDFEAIGYADEIALSKDPQEIAQLRIELKKLIGQSFEHWVIYERARLKHLQAELTKLKKNFEEDSKQKEAVIKHDMESLIKESKAFWKNSLKPSK